MQKISNNDFLYFGYIFYGLIIAYCLTDRTFCYWICIHHGYAQPRLFEIVLKVIEADGGVLQNKNAPNNLDRELLEEKEKR